MAVEHPERVTAIITQNGNAYVEGLSDGWNPIRWYWKEPTQANPHCDEIAVSHPGLSAGVECRLARRQGPPGGVMLALEVVPLPVTDIDRALAFYAEQAGFALDVDYRLTADFRVVQLTPPGSACSVLQERGHRAS